MPLLSVRTNVVVDVHKRSVLMKSLSTLVATLLHKPEHYVMVDFHDQCHLIFGGNTKPAAYLELKSIGLPVKSTADISKSLCGVLETELAIHPERVYIEFSDAQGKLWGWNNNTF